MPLFYFHLWTNGELILDPEGSSNPTLEAAQSEAIQGARCILSGDIKAGRINLNQRFEIHGEDGRHLFSVPCLEAVTIVEPEVMDRQPVAGGSVCAGQGQLHALIIEDEFLIAAAIEDALRDLGFTSFTTVATEDEAIAAAADRCPAIITSDVELAAGNGIDAVQRICGSGGCAVPVIYITGRVQEVHQRCATAIVIGKPFGIGVLRTAVEAAKATIRATA